MAEQELSYRFLRNFDGSSGTFLSSQGWNLSRVWWSFLAFFVHSWILLKTSLLYFFSHNRLVFDVF